MVHFDEAVSNWCSNHALVRAWFLAGSTFSAHTSYSCICSIAYRAMRLFVEGYEVIQLEGHDELYVHRKALKAMHVLFDMEVRQHRTCRQHSRAGRAQGIRHCLWHRQGVPND